MGLPGERPKIQSLDTGLRERPGDRFSGRGHPYQRRGMPGGGLDETDLCEHEERSGRIRVTTLLDHARPLSAGRRGVLGDVDVEECLDDVADLLRLELSQVFDDAGGKRRYIYIAHRFQCFGNIS